MFTSDCLNIDGGLWERTFQQELNENVIPYRGTSANLPLLSIDDDGYEYIKTKSEMKTVVLGIVETFSNESCVVYRMDTEYCRGESFARRLQISLPRLNGREFKVKVFDLNSAGIRDEADFPVELRRMLMAKKFIPTGRLVGNDCKKLHAYGVTITRWIELRGLCLEAVTTLDNTNNMLDNTNNTSLKVLAEYFLCGTLDKDGQMGDYSVAPLPISLHKYAALDALMSRLVFEKVARMLKLPQSNIIYEGPWA